jgi:hypothetical protein
MGYFSWLTADTNESISVLGADDPQHPTRPVWLLQPDGLPPILEESYEGYGDFGHVDAYAWLGMMNLPSHLTMEDGDPSDEDSGSKRIVTTDELRTIGVTLNTGSYCEDPSTGRRMAIFHEGAALIDPTIEHLAIRWCDPVPGYEGASANELMAQGRLVTRTFETKRPLKFSFDRNAVYENLPASEICPHQGAYYPAADEEDEDDEGVCRYCGHRDCAETCLDGDEDPID